MKISLGLVIALFVLGVIVNLTQHGHATAWTWLGYAPLLAYVLVWFVAWGISAIRKPKPPTTLNSFALPLLFLINFHLSGWVVPVLLIVAAWAWALTRKGDGDYSFLPGLAIMGAILFTVAVVVGTATGYFLR